MSTQALSALHAAYDSTGAQWGDGPAVVYDQLADALVGTLPDLPRGRLALDAGAGTGAATRALRHRGARVVAVDRSLPMLRTGAAQRPPAVVGDIRRLPLRCGGVDVAVAAFVLSHVPDPETALAELRRVTSVDGWVLASTFAPAPPHPAKAAVDEVAARFGYLPPPWYELLKRSYEANVGTAAGLAGLAGAAGLADAEVVETEVNLGCLTAGQLARWRLAMPHLADFLSRLSPRRRSDLTAAAVAALGARLPPLRLPVLFLRVRAR